jgi:hypothetical protein
LPIGAKILTPPSNTISPGSQDTNDSSTVWVAPASDALPSLK